MDCNTLVASVLIRPGFTDQYVKTIKPKQNIVKQDSSKCIRFVWKFIERLKLKAQLTSGLTVPKHIWRLLPFFWVAEKTVRLVQSQILALVETHRIGTGVVQPYSPLYDKVLVAETNKVVCVIPKAPIKR